MGALTVEGVTCKQDMDLLTEDDLKELSAKAGLNIMTRRKLIIAVTNYKRIKSDRQTFITSLLSGIPIVPDHIAQKLLRAQTQKEYLPQDKSVFSEHLSRLEEILSSCVEEARKASFDEFIERSISKLDSAEAEQKGREQKESFALEIDIDFRIANDRQYEEVKSR